MTYSKLVVAVFAIFAAFTTARATKVLLCRGTPVCTFARSKSGWIKVPSSKVKKVVGPKDCTLKEWTYVSGCSVQYKKFHEGDTNHAKIRCSGIVPGPKIFKYSKCERYLGSAFEKKEKKEETGTADKKTPAAREAAKKKAAAAMENWTKERKQLVDAKIDALLKQARKDGKSMNSCPNKYKVTIPGYGPHAGDLLTDKNCRRISYYNPSTPSPKVRTCRFFVVALAFATH